MRKNIDLNNKYIDEDNVVHIFITNKKGQKFEALYSGNHVNEVINSNWNVNLEKGGKVVYVQTGSYNGTSLHVCLHKVDFMERKTIIHINNDNLDNRIDNLTPCNQEENCRNRNTNNKYGLTSLTKVNEGFRSGFKYNNISIYTKIKHNLEEAQIDNLIGQRYLGYRHNEDNFYLLDSLPKERIKEVERLLQEKINNADKKKISTKKYNHKIIDCGEYKKLIWKNNEMLFDNNIDITNMKICITRDYWNCYIKELNLIVQNRFHREIMGLRPNDYHSKYNLHIDHLNHNKSDNRKENLIITTTYGNHCNKKGLGYSKDKNGVYNVTYMKGYRFFDLVGFKKKTMFKNEIEAINEISIRKEIIEEARVKLKNKLELEELIKYCLDNTYILENGLADLDLGYLYWRNIIS